jgi:hypothetical protein
MGIDLDEDATSGMDVDLEQTRFVQRRVQKG